MDVAWSRERLTTYLRLCEEIASHQAGNGYEWDRLCVERNRQAEQQLATVERIVHQVYPLAPLPLMPPSYSSADSEQYVRRALGALDDAEEIESRLQPDGPVVAADQLHSRIWGAASTVWDTTEYRAAVQLACTALSAQIRAKSGSLLRDRKLVAQVFSPNPPDAGSRRLHLPGDRSDESWRSRQEGLHLVAQGAFAGIRNIAAHVDEPWAEHEALEFLAVLSTIARWTDQTEVHTAG
ncbi:MAG: TIGR02391 family protein [Nocardioides sp.]